MRLLAPYRVLDLTGPLGFVAGKVMADLGADVVKIEPPGGDVRNLFWIAANAGKRSVVLDLHSEKGRDLFRQLAAKADFVLESFKPGTFDYEDLRALNPALIVVGGGVLGVLLSGWAGDAAR